MALASSLLHLTLELLLLLDELLFLCAQGLGAILISIEGFLHLADFRDEFSFLLGRFVKGCGCFLALAFFKGERFRLVGRQFSLQFTNLAFFHFDLFL